MKWVDILLGRQSRSISDITRSSAPSAGTGISQPRNDTKVDISTPSVCFCEVKALGPQLALERLRKSVQGFDPTTPSMPSAPYNDFCFGSIVPVHHELVKLDSLIALEKIRLGLWGTHGNSYGTTMKQGPHWLRYRFASWETPAIKVFERLIKTNPHLKFRIEINNPNLGFKMTVLGRKGRVFRWTAPNPYANEKPQTA